MDSFPPPPPAPSDSKHEPLFFSVSQLKLGVMSVVTFGVYELYWMYQNWKLIKKRTGQNVTPFWRAFFAVIFIYSLLKELRTTLENVDPEAHKNKLSAGWLAFAWILLSLASRLPDPYWLISFFSFIPLLSVQSRLNKANHSLAPTYPLNSKFTWVNWLWIIFVVIVVVLALIGLFLPHN